MELRRLGQSGLKVSVMSLGAMTFGESTGFMKGVTSSDDVARRVFDKSIERGVNLVDTANVYSEGRSEELTGKWIEGKRDKVLLATKCRFAVGGFAGPKVGPHEMGLSRQHILAACEASLRRLGTDHIDLYQVHMQDTSVGIEETLRALDDLQRAGKIRYAGCSNYTGYRLVESLWAADKRGTLRYEAVQLQWSLAVRDAEREIVPACAAHGLGILVWSPLARGFLSGKYERNQPAPPGSRLEAWKDSMKAMDTDRNWAIVDALRAVAKEVGSTPARVALAWLVARKEVTSIILGARDEAQLDDNLAALELSLSAAQLATLEEVSRPAWGYPQEFIARLQAW